MPPLLTADEVERFVALGEAGHGFFRAGQEDRAEAAFLGQVAIFGANPEPYVSLALLASARGDKKSAADWLRKAVVRGFTDLPRLAKAEAWLPMRGNLAFRSFIDAMPALESAERAWARWSAYEVTRPPRDVASALAEHVEAGERIDAMAPAIGPRLTRLWKTLFDRVTASRLETYVRHKADAPDSGEALTRLMQLYARGPLRGWQRMPAEAAGRLGDASARMLERFPDSPERASALIGLALARNAERDKRGQLPADAADAIRARLGEVLERHPDSPLAATAAVGLIRTDLEDGAEERAAARYRALCERRGADPLLAAVRDDLGVVALRLGGLPDFRAATLDGGSVAAEALRGKVAVLDFWATWCPPCVDGFPTLRRIHERYGDDVVVLGVNLDSADSLEADELREWVASRGVPGRQLYDGRSWESELVESFGVREIPFTVVVGPDGNVLAVNEHGKRLEKAVSAAVKARSES